MGKHKKKSHSILVQRTFVFQRKSDSDNCIVAKKLQRHLSLAKQTTGGLENERQSHIRTPLGRPHQCDPGSNPGVYSKRGQSLLLVLSLASRGFSPDTPVFPFPQKLTLPNSNSIQNAQTRLNEFIRTPKCLVGKQITIYNLQF